MSRNQNTTTGNVERAPRPDGQGSGSRSVSVSPIRRVRATFLLRLMLLFGAVAVPGLALTIFGFPRSVLGWMLLLIGTVVLQLVALVAEWCLVVRAASRQGALRSRWFVDLEERGRERMRRFFEATRDNPTLR